MDRSDNDNKTRLICPLVSEDIEQMKACGEQAAEMGADWLEFRLDYLSSVPSGEEVTDLISTSPLPAIVTCRPVREGGLYDGSEEIRLELLRHASECGAVTDIELDVPDGQLPRTNIIRSNHHFDAIPGDVDGVMSQIDLADGDITKIAFTAENPAEAITALDLATGCRRPAISLAMGEAGVASRILAAKAGSWGTFAALSADCGSAPGQPTLEEMHSMYRFDDIGPDTQIFGVIGCPVAHSMSPAIHNGAFAQTGFDGVYLPLLVPDSSEHFNSFIDSVLAHPDHRWRGFSVTIPHKLNALNRVGMDHCDELSARIGAINTITIEPDGTLRGCNTDYAGVLDSLTAAMGVDREDLKGMKVAVLGAGGVARATVAAMSHYGASTVIYNRTVSKAEKLASEFGAKAMGSDQAANTDAEIVINCTSLGMHPQVDTTPLPVIPDSVRVIFDTVYNPPTTRLLTDGSAAGVLTISGVEMFVNQAAAQFFEWTGSNPPLDLMRSVVLDRLGQGS